MKYLKAIETLKPKGQIWNYIFGSNYQKFVNAVSKEFDRLYEFISNVRKQAIPSDATIMLPEWVNIYNINLNLEDDKKRSLAKVYYSSTGNQSSRYIEQQLALIDYKVEFEERIFSNSECGIIECGGSEIGSPGFVVVVKTNVSSAELKQIKKLIEYYRPLHVPFIYINKGYYA